MAEPITNVLGIVGMENKGAYDADAYYEKLNVVSYQGSSYCALDSVHNVLPTDTTKWQLIAEKGDKGDTNLTTFDIVDGELKAYDDKGVIYNLGTVAMEPRGEYDAETYYKKLNTVLYNDSTYMAKEGVVGENPSTSSKWQLIGGGITKEYLEDQTIDNLDSTSTTKPLSAKQGNNLNKSKVEVFDTVALMKAANLKNGMTAQTLGYYDVNDGGGATYKITNTASLSEYQEELSNELYATLIIENEIIPLQLGAKGDGTTDDTLKIQLAITNFNIINGLNKTYLISDELTLKDSIEIKNCKFKGNNLLTGMTGDKLRNIYIHNCEFNTFNKAIELSCYWSTFDNIIFYECGECFYMINGTADGNLVENKYMNCDAQNVGRFLLLQSGNKLTDSFIKNININCNDSSKNAINIGSGAGHTIDTIHIYGTTNTGLAINNSYNVSINNLYIENYETNALYISAQLSVNLNNLIINAKNNKNIIDIEKEGTSYFTDVCVNINNLMINGTNAITPTNVIYSGTSPRTQINNISVDSSYTLNGFYNKANLLINNHFISMADKQLFVENRQLQTEKIEYMSGSAKTSTIPILIRSYAQRYFHVTFLYTTWLSGTTLNKIETDVLISRPNDNDVVITKTNSTMPITITYDKTNQTASFTYTPADNTQYGNLVIKY